MKDTKAPLAPDKLLIAVDGPAASGKGTLARRLADHYGLAYLDTGLIYRAVGWKVLGWGAKMDSEAAIIKAASLLTAEDLKNPDLREDYVSVAASHAGAVGEARALLLDFQRDFAKNPPLGKRGAVLDGRDIGTVVCPDADVKFYITAEVAERAKRRYNELVERGMKTTYDRILETLKRRDHRDSTRTSAPLKPAVDALVLDTSTLNSDQVFDTVVAHIAEKSPNLLEFDLPAAEK